LVALLFLVTVSVTYGIVHDHRGAIQIESEPGQGASFVLTFPVAEGAPSLPGPADDVRSD
jgi:K+-sensing histidine kinase KdpD